MTTPYSRGWKQNLVPDIPDIGFLLDFEKKCEADPSYSTIIMTVIFNINSRSRPLHYMYKLLPTVDFTDEIWLPIKGHQPDQSNEQTI